MTSKEEIKKLITTQLETFAEVLDLRIHVAEDGTISFQGVLK